MTYNCCTEHWPSSVLLSRQVSGILGLAFPGLTNQYASTSVSDNAQSNYLTYENFFCQMVGNHLTLPTFSFAPERNGSNGYLAFGGVPPVNTTRVTAVTQILTVSLFPSRSKQRELV
jgi:hypothetical protein